MKSFFVVFSLIFLGGNVNAEIENVPKNLNSILETMEAKFAAKIQSLENKIEKLQTQNEEFEEKYEKLEAENRDLKAENRDLKKKIDDFEERLSHVEEVSKLKQVRTCEEYAQHGVTKSGRYPIGIQIQISRRF